MSDSHSTSPNQKLDEILRELESTLVPSTSHSTGRRRKSLFSSAGSKLVGMASFFVLLVGITTAAFVSQQSQELRQQASTNLCAELDGKGEGDPCSEQGSCTITSINNNSCYRGYNMWTCIRRGTDTTLRWWPNEGSQCSECKLWGACLESENGSTCRVDQCQGEAKVFKCGNKQWLPDYGNDENNQCATICPWGEPAAGQPCCPKAPDACSIAAGNQYSCIEDPFLTKCVKYSDQCGDVGVKQAVCWWPNTQEGRDACIADIGVGSCDGGTSDPPPSNPPPQNSPTPTPTPFCEAEIKLIEVSQVIDPGKQIPMTVERELTPTTETIYDPDSSTIAPTQVIYVKENSTITLKGKIRGENRTVRRVRFLNTKEEPAGVNFLAPDTELRDNEAPYIATFSAKTIGSLTEATAVVKAFIDLKTDTINYDNVCRDKVLIKILKTSPTPSPTPTIAPLCTSISMSVTSGQPQPIVGSSVAFTCGQVVGISRYDFRVQKPDKSIVSLAPVSLNSRVSQPFLINQSGSYVAQCRICYGPEMNNSCAAWEPLTPVTPAPTATPTPTSRVIPVPTVPATDKPTAAPTTKPTSTPTLRPTVIPSAKATSTPTPTPAICNKGCTSDAQCGATTTWICYLPTGAKEKMCRLRANPTSATCSSFSPSQTPVGF